MIYYLLYGIFTVSFLSSCIELMKGTCEPHDKKCSKQESNLDNIL